MPHVNISKNQGVAKLFTAFILGVPYQKEISTFKTMLKGEVSLYS
jgi:hypothetical protein